jgi:hypothetical protein
MRAPTWIGLVIVIAGLSVYVTWRIARPAAAAPVPGPPYVLTGAIKDIMEGVIEPSADVIFESVAVINDASGSRETVPRTDEEWARVEHNALMLAEAANLIMMPGRAIARADQASTKSDEAVPELTPPQIQQKIDADRSRWNQHATVLLQQATRALQLARTRSVAGLYEVGGDLDEACENCHLEYWYPNAARPPGGAR